MYKCTALFGYIPDLLSFMYKYTLMHYLLLLDHIWKDDISDLAILLYLIQTNGTIRKWMRRYCVNE